MNFSEVDLETEGPQIEITRLAGHLFVLDIIINSAMQAQV